MRNSRDDVLVAKDSLDWMSKPWRHFSRYGIILQPAPIVIYMIA